jgi:polyphosphate kinase
VNTPFRGCPGPVGSSWLSPPIIIGSALLNLALNHPGTEPERATPDHSGPVRLVAAGLCRHDGEMAKASTNGRMQQAAKPERVPREVYEAELLRLQAELVEMQEWVRATGARLVVVFEGRDAAGKGGAIKRVTEYLNPRVCRIVALPAPTERERTQWYFQRYIEHLPAAGEIALFDRSWYNRAGVERVMGFADPEQQQRFLRQCPVFERLLVEDRVLLHKYWFSVSDAEQERRFRSRMKDPMRRWKLSAMDLQSVSRWEDYSRAKDEMFAATDIPEAPWLVVESEDKRRARLNMIAHLLSAVPWKSVPRPKLKLPERPPRQGYRRPPREMFRVVPDHAATLQG